MHSAFESAMNELLADFAKTRDEMLQTHQAMSGLTGTAKSKRRQVSAVVDAHGDLVELTFHGEGYRALPPRELADVIVRTIRAARESVQAQVWDCVGDRLPPGAEMRDVVAGRYDWSDALGEVLTIPEPLLDALAAAAPKDPFGDPDRVAGDIAAAVGTTGTSDAGAPREAATASGGADRADTADEPDQVGGTGQ